MAARKPRTSGPSGAHSSSRIKVSVLDDARRVRWEAAARGAGVSLAVWLRRLGDAAADAWHEHCKGPRA